MEELPRPGPPSWKNLTNLLQVRSALPVQGITLKISYGALANLQTLHTLEWVYDGLDPNSMKNLQILKSSDSDSEVIKALLTTDPPVQLKEL
jgi:hypothetical protein